MAFEQAESYSVQDVRDGGKKSAPPEITLNDMRDLNERQSKNGNAALPALEITGAEKVKSWVETKSRQGGDYFGVIDKNKDGKLQLGEIESSKARATGDDAVMLQTLSTNYESFRNANKYDNAANEFEDGISRSDITEMADQASWNAHEDHGLKNAQDYMRKNFSELAGEDGRITRADMDKKLNDPQLRGDDLEAVKYIRDNYSTFAQSTVDSADGTQIQHGRKMSELTKEEQRAVRKAESSEGISQADLDKSTKKFESNQVGRFEEQDIKWTLDKDARVAEHQAEMKTANSIKGAFGGVEAFGQLDRDGMAVGHMSTEERQRMVSEFGEVSKQELATALKSDAFTPEQKQVIQLMSDNFDELSQAATRAEKGKEQTISFKDVQNYPSVLEDSYIYRDVKLTK